MKYRPTPLNLLSGITICIAIYCVIKPGPEGWGIIGLETLLPFGIIGLFGDFLLQKILKKYFTLFVIEICFLSFLFLCYSWTQRTKTFLIPNHLPSRYITTIYGVDKAQKLPKKYFNWSYEIKIPKSGILMTSSNINDDLPETKIKTYTGELLNTNSSKLGWVDFMDDTFDCAGKIYYFKSWIVDSSETCCISTSQEADSFKVHLQKQFCSGQIEQ